MKQLLGGILIAIGILIAGASGLCSLYFLFGSGGALNLLPLVLVIGGLPFALGVALVFGGRSMILDVRKQRGHDAESIADIFE